MKNVLQIYSPEKILQPSFSVPIGNRNVLGVIFHTSGFSDQTLSNLHSNLENISFIPENA